MKGPADRLMRAVGAEVSALGVARLYRSFVRAMVIDGQDAELAAPIEALGLRTRVTETLMRNSKITRQLAETVIELAREGA